MTTIKGNRKVKMDHLHAKQAAIPLDGLNNRLEEIGGCGSAKCMIYVGPKDQGMKKCKCWEDNFKLKRALGAHIVYTLDIEGVRSGRPA